MNDKPDVVVDAYGAHICTLLMDRLVIGLRLHVGRRVPLDKFLIVSHEKQFELFASLFNENTPPEEVDGETFYQFPVEIKFARIRWEQSNALPENMIRMEAGTVAFGIIQNLGTVGI